MLQECTDVYPKSGMRYNYLIFVYLSSGHRIHGKMDVSIRGYFSKPQGVREQKKCFGNSAVGQLKFRILHLTVLALCHTLQPEYLKFHCNSTILSTFYMILPSHNIVHCIISHCFIICH